MHLFASIHCKCVLLLKQNIKYCIVKFESIPIYYKIKSSMAPFYINSDIIWEKETVKKAYLQNIYFSQNMETETPLHLNGLHKTEVKVRRRTAFLRQNAFVILMVAAVFAGEWLPFGYPSSVFDLVITHCILFKFLMQQLSSCRSCTWVCIAILVSKTDFTSKHGHIPRRDSHEDVTDDGVASDSIKSYLR